MDHTLNPHKTSHTSPLQVCHVVSIGSILEKNKPYYNQPHFMCHFPPRGQLKPVAQIPQCTSLIYHNALFCNRNVHIFVTKWCIVGYLPNALWNLWDGFVRWPNDPHRCDREFSFVGSDGLSPTLEQAIYYPINHRRQVNLSKNHNVKWSGRNVYFSQGLQ